MQVGPIINELTRPVYPKIFRLFILISAVAFGATLFIQWQNLTPCFQREGITVFATLIYWGVRGFNDVLHFFEVLQFFLLYIMTLKLNTSEANIDSSCLAMNSVFTQIISACFFFLFGYHLGVVIAMACLVLVYIFYQCYHRYYVLPRLQRNSSVRGDDFDQLERVKFKHNQAEGSDERTTCSICLVDFEENEEVIRLPICNHHFHQPCLKQWLHMQRVCPYCRADIKINQRLLREGNNRRDNENAEPEIRENNHNNSQENFVINVEGEPRRRPSVNRQENNEARGANIELVNT